MSGHGGQSTRKFLEYVYLPRNCMYLVHSKKLCEKGKNYGSADGTNKSDQTTLTKNEEHVDLGTQSMSSI